MKLTRTQLKEIIKEELQSLNEREEIHSLNENRDYMNKYVKPVVKKAGGKAKFFKMPERERYSFIIDFLKNDLKLSTSFIRNMTYSEDWEADFYYYAEQL